MNTKNTFIAFAVAFATSLMNGNAQNIGINATGATPNSSAMLDVASTTKGLLIPRMTGTEKYAVPTPATGLLIFQTDTIGFWYYNGTNWLPLLSSTTNTAANTSGWGLAGNGDTNSGSNFLGTSDNKSLRFRTNNTERMVVDSLGNVGIGTTAPAYKLDILDNSTAGSGITSTAANNVSTRTANVTALTQASCSSNNITLAMTESAPGTQARGYGSNSSASVSGTNTFFQISGAINTGTSTSTAAVGQSTIFGAINNAVFNASSGTVNNAYGTYNQCFNNGAGTLTSAVGGLNVAGYTSSTGAGSVTNAFGSTSIVQNLSTAGGSIGIGYGVYSRIIKAAGASAIGTGYLFLGQYGTTADATTRYGVYTQNEQTNYFSGNVGIGTTTPTAKLHVVGNICYTGTIGACSDSRYKTNIKPIPNALSKVMQLQGVNYYWKVKEYPDKNFSTEKQLGFIAQDIEKVYPEVVMTDNDGYKSVDYSRLTPVLVEAIKEQQKEIEKLKGEKASAELRITKLETAMQKLVQQGNAEETRK